MREKEEVTRLIFWRHGITYYPEDRIYKEEEDPLLSKEGQSQAKRLMEKYKDSSIEAVYTSTASRTRSTAEPFCNMKGIIPDISEKLKERNFGIWEGLSFIDIESNYPEGYRSWKEDPIDYKPEDGESIRELDLRVNNYIDELINCHTGKTVLIVSHVGPIRMAIVRALGMPLINYRRLNIPYGSVVRIDYGKKQSNLIYSGYIP
ncbi:MAG: histidine phosphatase family protein [Nitrospirota bacterium]